MRKLWLMGKWELKLLYEAGCASVRQKLEKTPVLAGREVLMWNTVSTEIESTRQVYS